MDASRDGLVPRPRNAARPKRGSGSRGLTSAYIPAGTVIGVIPQGLAAGYAGIAEIETSTAATVHVEDATPLPIGTPGSPPTVAAPTLSAFQSGLIVIKVRGRVAWCVQPGSISVITGASW